jgi:PAS domain S-box-containing protein
MLTSVSAALFAGLPDGVLILDQDGRYQDANPAVCQLLGYTRDELLRLRDVDLIPQDATWVIEARAANATTGSWRGEIELVRGDGTLAPLEAWSLVVPGPEGPLYASVLREMSESRRRETTNARLAAVVQASADAIISVSLEGIITSWNPAAERLYGYTAEEAIGQPVVMLTPAERAHEIEQFLARLRTGESIHGVETVRRTKDGRLIEVSLTAAPVRNAAGEVVATASIIRDITDRRRMEEQLRASEERFRTAFDHAAIGMSLVDLDGRFVQVNAAQCALTGYAEAELLTKTFQEITHPDDLAADLAQMDRLLAGEIRAFQMEKRYLRKDGELIWIRLNSALVRDARGAPLHFIGQLEDITERKRAEEELLTSEARFRSLISNATDIITILDAEGVIHYESPPIERILGYDRDELLGHNAFDLVHPDDRAAVWAVFEEVLADPARVPTVEFRFLHADGSWRWLESTGTNLLADPNVRGFVVNSRDVTDRKRANDELRAALDAAQAANRAKGVFLDMMSHELRTPLQAVLGYSESLLAAPQRSLTAEQREDIGYIHQAGGRMIALINQLLDLSRMEAGRLQLAAEPVDLAQVIEQVRQDVAPQAAAKSLAVQIELPPALPAVIGDAERVRQILLNLVGNAVKFTNQGCIRIVAAPSVSGGVEVNVSDSGIGITPDGLLHIFDEFHQGDSSLTRRHGGAGLGLAIARKLAEQMGGGISVSSEPNVGSTFRLHLPVGQP